MLTLYWLSKNGYECALVDHTGIDIIAKGTNGVWGISVKTRTRSANMSKTRIGISISDDIPKINAACESFDCIPYVSFVVDVVEEKKIYLFILSCEHLKKICDKSQRHHCVYMSKKAIEKHFADPEIKSVVMNYSEFLTTN